MRPLGRARFVGAEAEAERRRLVPRYRLPEGTSLWDALAAGAERGEIGTAVWETAMDAWRHRMLGEAGF